MPLKKKIFPPGWSLYTLNPKISHLNMQGIEDSQWTSTGNNKTFSLICHLWDWTVHIHSSVWDIKSPLFSGKSCLSPPCPPCPCFLQITSFSQLLILVWIPDPTLILASLNFPHQFDFSTCCCSKQDKQPMAEQMKIQSGARPSSGWGSFCWQLKKTFAPVVLWAGACAILHTPVQQGGQ